ncbi:hypothetical protein DFH09DRAFT_1328700 [Mycena vulgaris]|nr:hypothetical protein DFH09DRAFT_1328700 [Mycena vulgaris]
MPPGARRAAREKALLKAYVRNNKGRQRRQLLRQRAAARIRRENPTGNTTHDYLDLLSSISSGNDSDSSSEDSSSGNDWADILGADWRHVSDILDDFSDITGLTSEPSTPDSSMPDLHSIGSSSSSSSTDSEWDWSSDSVSGAADDEESSDDNSDDGHRPPFLRQFHQQTRGLLGSAA